MRAIKGEQANIDGGVVREHKKYHVVPGILQRFSPNSGSLPCAKTFAWKAQGVGRGGQG